MTVDTSTSITGWIVRSICIDDAPADADGGAAGTGLSARNATTDAGGVICDVAIGDCETASALPAVDPSTKVRRGVVVDEAGCETG